MAEPQEQASVLTSYRFTVYASGDLDPEDARRVAEAIDDEIHEALFQLAARLERRHPAHVTAVDERGAGWIAGGLGVRHELGFDSSAPLPPVRARRPVRPA